MIKIKLDFGLRKIAKIPKTKTSKLKKNQVSETFSTLELKKVANKLILYLLTKITYNQNNKNKIPQTIHSHSVIF